MLATTLYAAGAIRAQETIPEDVVEEVVPESDNEAHMEDLVELLEERAARPIFLPYAHAEKLYSLPFLTPYQIQQLLALRDSMGLRMQWADIQRLSSIDSITLLRLHPFIRLGRPPRPPRWDLQGILRNSLTSTDITSYPRTPLKTYFRCIARRRHWQGGILYEKDAGEAWRNPAGMPQYLSFHVGFQSERLRGIIGDYSVRWGQGLILWQGFAMARSQEAVRFFRYLPPLRPHTSVDEFHYFRGVALRRRLSEQWEGMIFVSHRKLDARLDSMQDAAFIAGFDEDGYHRTQTRLARWHNARMTALGAAAERRGRFTRWSCHGLALHFDRVLSPATRPDRSTIPAAQTWLYGSVSWKKSWQRAFIFGETAVQSPLGWGTTAGVLTRIADVSTGFLVRHYSRTFYPLLGQPWGISSSYAPENGLYYALSVVRGAWTASFYADVGRPLFLRYLQPRPLARYDWMIRLSHRRYGPHFYLFFRRKNIPQTASRAGESTTLTDLPLHTLRLDYRTPMGPSLQWHARAETRWLKDSLENASFVMLQDIRWTAAPHHKLTWRIAWATATSHDTRIYAYEPNVRYTFSFFQFTRPAIRTLLLWQWKRPSYTVESRAGYTFLTSDAGAENHRWDATIQLLWRL